MSTHLELTAKSYVAIGTGTLVRFSSSPNVMSLNGNGVDCTASGISSSKFISAHNFSISSGDKISSLS